MQFDAALGDHRVAMDAKAPIGTGAAPTPKDLVLAAICGCTGMDVAALLRKAKQTPATFEIEARAEQTGGHPSVFQFVDLVYRTTGDVDTEVLADAVRRSMTAYCGVSAMIAKTCPISYKVEHEGRVIASGEARFS